MSKFLDLTGLQSVVTKMKALLALKQDTLTAGSKIDITNNVIDVIGEPITKITTSSINISTTAAGVYQLPQGCQIQSGDGSTYTTVSTSILFVDSKTGSMVDKAWYLLDGSTGDGRRIVYGYLQGSIGQCVQTTLDALERTSNKVTSLSSSSTNTQYPSAKLVYDQLETKAVKNHASKATTFGTGDTTYYGHTRIVDDLNASTYKAGDVLSSYQGYVLNQAKEAVANKVTSLSSSSTNTQYPSAKAVYDEINTKISSVYKAKGTCTFANKPALQASNEGFVYNISDAFTTTADFVEGAGKSYPAGTNIVVINNGTTSSPSWKYDVLAGMTDLSGYVAKTGDTMTGNLVTTGLSAGLGLTNIGSCQVVEGHFNIPDTELHAGSGNNLALIIGNGHGDNDKSNAHTLDWDGNAWFAGSIYVGSTSGTNKDAGSIEVALAPHAIIEADIGTNDNNIFTVYNWEPGLYRIHPDKTNSITIKYSTTGTLVLTSSDIDITSTFYCLISGTGDISDPTALVSGMNENFYIFTNTKFFRGSTKYISGASGTLEEVGGKIDSISLNGITQAVDANKNVDLVTPIISYGEVEPTSSFTAPAGSLYCVYG